MSSSTTQKELSPGDQAKRSAAYKAVEDHFSSSARNVGIGSGTTVVFVVEAIASRGAEVTSQMTFFPTGFQSRDLIVQAGLRLGSIDSLGEDVMLDVAFDGADEVDQDLNCIKGGGACLLQEKLVAINARKFICVADHRKLQSHLLTQWRTIPIEVVALAAPTVLRSLKRLGSTKPAIRAGGSAKAGPIVTDNGNFIIDAPFPHPLLTSEDLSEAGDGTDGKWHVATLAQRLKELVGVVETGLFWGVNGDEGQQQTRRNQNAAGGPVVLHAQKPVAAYFGTEEGEVLVRTAGG